MSAARIWRPLCSIIILGIIIALFATNIDAIVTTNANGWQEVAATTDSLFIEFVYDSMTLAVMISVVGMALWVLNIYGVYIVNALTGIMTALLVAVSIVPEAVTNVCTQSNVFGDTPPTLTSYVQNQYVTNDMQISEYEQLLEYYWPYIARERGWLVGYANTPLSTPGDQVAWEKQSVKQVMERETYKP